MLEPKLPADLERIIFELAAHEDRQTTLDIILVARRCRAWIERILYRSLVVCQSSWGLPILLRTLESDPDRFAELIKDVRIDPYITLNTPAVSRILSICTGIVHLVDLSYGRTPLSVIHPLRLERMCISLDAIESTPEHAFRSPAFTRLTHLQLLDPPKTWPRIPFSDLPSLTHLALHNYVADIRTENVPVLENILASCSLLEVLVVCIPFCRPQDRNVETARLLAEMPRIVVLSRPNNSSHDLWPQEQYTAQETILIRDPWRKKPTRRRRKKRTV
ncbi:hypothetical protein FB45DRAFT_1058395 [Roridomyces roridus]|uniref:F-box domain-containing protein n=1 Tax=Roridomyces roridus TaxID=1738132 RepID=A0AAD7FNV0_9AGAR|nr:hypothetical protein FB45DRAFT_1058395 [Roridomyces roridus]